MKDMYIVDGRRTKEHYYPWTRDIGKFYWLLISISENKPGFRPIPRWAIDGAIDILHAVKLYYPRKGRRLSAFVVAALAIARGDKKVEEMQDLVERVKYILGKEIPPKQVSNTFFELRIFLKYLKEYKIIYQLTLKF